MPLDEKSRYLRLAFQSQKGGAAERHHLAEAEAEAQHLWTEVENLWKAEETLRETLLCATRTIESTQKQAEEREALARPRPRWSPH